MNKTTYDIPFERLYRKVETNVEIVDQIFSFALLPNGWHYGEGCGATEFAVELALIVNSLLIERNASDIEVFPDINGGILVSGYHENETIEILCDEIGQINVIHEDDENVVCEQMDVSVQELSDYLEGLLWRSTKLSDFFIRNISVGERGDLRVLHSKIPQTKVVYRSSTHDALEKLVEPNANTLFSFTIPTSQGTPQLFGELKQQIYQ